MKVLIIGSAGMLGQKLLSKLIDLGKLKGEEIKEIELFDVNKTQIQKAENIKITAKKGNLLNNRLIKALIISKPDVIFHLAAIVSGQAEAEFDLGWDIKTKATWDLFENIRSIGNGYRPKLVFTSSIAVFGAPFPNKIND